MLHAHCSCSHAARVFREDRRNRTNSRTVDCHAAAKHMDPSIFDDQGAPRTRRASGPHIHICTWQPKVELVSSTFRHLVPLNFEAENASAKHTTHYSMQVVSSASLLSSLHYQARQCSTSHCLWRVICCQCKGLKKTCLQCTTPNSWHALRNSCRSKSWAMTLPLQMVCRVQSIVISHSLSYNNNIACIVQYPTEYRMHTANSTLHTASPQYTRARGRQGLTNACTSMPCGVRDRNSQVMG